LRVAILGVWRYSIPRVSRVLEESGGRGGHTIVKLVLPFDLTDKGRMISDPRSSSKRIEDWCGIRPEDVAESRMVNVSFRVADSVRLTGERSGVGSCRLRVRIVSIIFWIFHSVCTTE
jgi:hypothetical protein